MQDESAYLNSVMQFYTSALQWATPPGTPTPTMGTAIATGVPWDFGAASEATLAANSGGWFSALQGSFQNNYAFLNHQFQQQQQFLGPTANRILTSTDQLQEANIYAIRKLAKRASKRGLFSKVFG